MFRFCLIVCFCVFAASSHSLYSQTSFLQDITNAGFDRETVNNQSDSSNVKLEEEPLLAYVNITGVNVMPSVKGSDYQAWIECYDGQGNYFKKRILLDAQGNTSLRYFPKKNFSVDFFNDEWLGEDIPNIRIGKWIKQESFHFKAYYNDYQRGGCAQLGYRLFADMIADLPKYQERAGLEDWSKKALCFPEGFPCIVYLNGDFYGIYSWQLKKHRDNMDQKKKKAEHIHLDGKLSNVSLFHDTIDWTLFEVRNPKGLITIDGQDYDGDAPIELLDEMCAAYDSTNESHVRSALVKHYIKTLSHYNAELSALELEATTEEMRDAISERFDVTGMLDYSILALISANYDAFEKNWQWFTYDGYKWFVAPYDLDSSFGNQFHGHYIMDATYTCYTSDHKMENITSRGPSYWIFRYFFDDIKSRYSVLRDNGVLSVEHIMEYVYDWQNRVGMSNYTREYNKWTESFCNRDLILDPNWVVEEWKNYDVHSLEFYNGAKTYSPGDVIWDSYFVWKAIGTSRGKKPYVQIGYHDSVSRVLEWVTQRLQLEDEYLVYSPDEYMSYQLTIHSAGAATLCLPFSYEIPEGIGLYDITGVTTQGFLQLDSVVVAEANHPYLVLGEPGTYTIRGIHNPGEIYTNGFLVGVDKMTYAPKDSYVLQQNRNQDAIFRHVENDNEIALAAYKAYLTVPHLDSATAPAILRLPISQEENESDGICPIEMEQNEYIYSAFGYRISGLQPGLAIRSRNGERVVMWIK